MIDVLIPFLFGLMVGAGGGVMIAALLVASRDTPPQPREAVRYVGGVIPDAEQATENLRRTMRKLYGTPIYETDARIGRWIPVTERLPEYMEPVLTWDGGAYCVEKRIPYIRDDDGEPIEGDWWVSDDYDEYDSDYYPNLRDGACIAWQPLPEPYQKGKQ